MSPLQLSTSMPSPLPHLQQMLLRSWWGGRLLRQDMSSLDPLWTGTMNDLLIVQMMVGKKPVLELNPPFCSHLMFHPIDYQ